jgi:hypothetical protein
MPTLFNKIRTHFNGQTREEFGLGERHLLTKAMSVDLRRHINTLARSDISGFKFERRRSAFPGASSDLVIYDQNEKAILVGREMDGGSSFWAP